MSIRRLTVICVMSLAAIPSTGANESLDKTRDSQTFLRANLKPAIPVASDVSAAVERLLRQMTIKEKIGQMTQLEVGMIADGTGQNMRVNYGKLRKATEEYGVGSILNVNDESLPAERWQEIIRAIQTQARATRLHIPVLYGIDTIHGANYVTGSTLFPQPLAMAATWNPELMLRASQIAAAETRKSGIPWSFSPVLDVGRQPLWPRLYETFGEDTYLATVMGVATVRGYEANNVSANTNVAACLKHYVGYSNPTNGGDRSPALIPETTLREYFLPTFAAAVRAGAHTVMVNSSEVNGIPGHINTKLLTDVLRGELGFDGVVVSDWGDIKKLTSVHHIASDEKDATRLAVLAGIDMSMVPSDYTFSDLLVQLVQEGKVPISRIDEAVRRILVLKFQLGLFVDPVRGIEAQTVIGSPESRQISLEAAREAITLLKNDHQTLPLSKAANILVTGPDADSLIPLNNGWTYTWQGGRAKLYPKDYPTILKAIKNKIGEGQVVYLPDPTIDKAGDSRKLIDAVVRADAVVICVGEWSYAETPGNIADLTLADEQLSLVEQVLKQKKPTVLVLTEGRPRVISRVADAVSAIIMAYNPGNQGGQAIADVLFGDVNPSGKLPITYPRWPNRLFTYDHKEFEREDSAQGAILDSPQFEFGFGLSFTNFVYSGMQVHLIHDSDQQTLIAEITVRNSGQREGKEVVELYVSQHSASITPPRKRLKRFVKILLAPGEIRHITFELTAEDLSFIGAENKLVFEPGLFDLTIGGLSQTIDWK